MKKEERINEYLEEIFDEFDFVGAFGIKKCVISSKYLHASKDIEPSKRGINRVKLSDEEIIKTARVIINDINPDFVKDFDNFISTNNIIIKKSEIQNFVKNHRAYYDIKYNKKGLNTKIVMYKQNDYYSVCTLIHEFMHSTNIKKHPKGEEMDHNYVLRKELSEFISIYFEMYARDYLINNFNIDNNMIDLSERFNSNTLLANADLEECTPYLIYKKHGSVSYENYLKVLEEYEIPLLPSKKEYYVTICSFYNSVKNVIKEVDAYKNRNKEDPDFDRIHDLLFILLWAKLSQDNYILSSMLYFSVKDKLNKEDILKFNELLGKENTEESKYLNPDFKKIMLHYINLDTDKEAYDNLETFLKSVYDNKGRLKKNYKM